MWRQFRILEAVAALVGVAYRWASPVFGHGSYIFAAVITAAAALLLTRQR